MKLERNWGRKLSFSVVLADKSNLNEPLENVFVNDGIIRITCPPFSLTGLKEI